MRPIALALLLALAPIIACRAKSRPARRRLTATGRPPGSPILPRRFANPWSSIFGGHWTSLGPGRICRPRERRQPFHFVCERQARGRRPRTRRSCPLALRAFRPGTLSPARHNLITATVWNFGVYAPVAQMSDRTAFLLESEAAGATDISTPEGWLVEEEPGHRPSRSLDRDLSRPTSPPAPAKKSMPRNTTGIGTPPPPARTGFPPLRQCATASSTARQSCPLRRHHGRQSVGADSR